MDNLEEQLRIEQEKTRVIREKLAKQESMQIEMNEDFENRCVGPLTTILEKLLAERQAHMNAVTTNGMDTETSEQRVQKVRDLLKNGEFDTLALYIIKLDNEAGHDEALRALPLNEQVMYFIVLLNSYMFDEFVSRCPFFPSNSRCKRVDKHLKSFLVFAYRKTSSKNKIRLLAFCKMHSNFPNQSQMLFQNWKSC